MPELMINQHEEVMDATLLGKRKADNPVGFLSEMFGWNQAFVNKRFASDKRPFTAGYPSTQEM